jgi:hypothetical protein
MKVELHLHTSRYSGCATSTPWQMLTELVKRGYQAVCITEHDAFWSDYEIAELQAVYPQVRIFPGVELSLASPGGAGHLLVLGANDRAFLAMRDEPGKLLRWADQEGCLTILAHPFRWKGGADVLSGNQLPDAIEHYTCNQSDEAAEEAEVAARRLGLHLVNAGDSHDISFLGRYWIETRQDFQTIPQLRQIIREGEYDNRKA